MRVVIDGDFWGAHLGGCIVEELQLQILRERLERFAIALATRKDRAEWLRELRERHEADSNGVQTRRFRALIEILELLPVNGRAAVVSPDLYVAGGVESLVSQVTSQEFALHARTRNYCPQEAETREDVFNRLFFIPIMTAKRAVIYDAYAAVNLCAYTWQMTGSAWFIERLLKGELAEIHVITELPGAGPSAAKRPGWAPPDADKVSRKLGVLRKNLAALVELSGSRVADAANSKRIRMTFNSDVVHDRCIRFDDAGATSGCAAVLGKGMESFETERMSNAAIAPFDWQAARSWRQPVPDSRYADLTLGFQSTQISS